MSNQTHHDLFDQIPASSLEKIFQEFIDKKQEYSKDPAFSLPPITFRLHSGHTIVGQLISISEPSTTDTKTLLIQETKTYDICYLPLSSISAATFHCSPENISILSFGNLRRFPPEIPGKLDLLRSYQQIGEWLTKQTKKTIKSILVWASFYDSEKNRYQLHLFGKTLLEIFQEIIATESGKEALVKQLQSIVICSGERTEILKIQKNLQISIFQNQESLQIPERLTMQEQIEQLLK